MQYSVAKCKNLGAIEIQIKSPKSDGKGTFGSLYLKNFPGEADLRIPEKQPLWTGWRSDSISCATGNMNKKKNFNYKKMFEVHLFGRFLEKTNPPRQKLANGPEDD